MQDVSPKGRDVACYGSVHDSPPPTAARDYRIPASSNLKEAEMTHDDLRKLESTRRKALREIARYLPGDSEAADALAILDDLDDKERNAQPLCKATYPALHHASYLEYPAYTRLSFLRPRWLINLLALVRVKNPDQALPGFQLPNPGIG